MDFPGIDGFLGTRAPLVLDVLFLTMFVVVVVLGWSIYQVKYRRRYRLYESHPCESLRKAAASPSLLHPR